MNQGLRIFRIRQFVSNVKMVFALKPTEKVRREFLLTLAFTIKSFNNLDV